jgi:hypothetical protein
MPTNRGELIVALACAIFAEACRPAPRARDEVVLDAACHARAGELAPRVKVTIRNETAQHVSMVVGFIVGNGDRLAQGLSLRLKPFDTIDEEEFGYLHPRYPAVAGWVDAWRLEVAAGRASDLEVDGSHFLSRRSFTRFSLSAGQGDLRVLLRGLGTPLWPGLQLTKEWTGTAASNPIRFPDGCTVSG